MFTYVQHLRNFNLWQAAFFGQSQTMVFVGMYATAAHANFVLGITCQVPDNFSIDKQNTRFADKKLINNK